MQALLRDDVNAQAVTGVDFDADRWIMLERLRLVYGNLPVVLLVSLACACILAALLAGVVSPVRLSSWLCGGVLLSWVRYRHYREFRRLPAEAVVGPHWTRRMMLGTGASGLFWGSSALVLFPPGELPQQVAIAFVLAGLSAGAMTSYAALPRCYFLFVLPALLPISLRMALQDSDIHHWMAILVLLYLGGVIRVCLETDRMIANVLKVRIENFELTRELRHQATHDSLVDLPNHREFNARLMAIAEASSKRREPYVLLFIDLDRFKVVNDTGGHAAGDEMLRHVSRILKRHMGSSDTAARLGGDEFAVLLPRCPLERAQHMAEKILAAIDDCVLHWESGHLLKVGASVGLAYSVAGEEDAPAMLRAADAACYAAKSAGRGRIEICRAGPDYAPSGRFDISRLRSRLSGSA